MLSDANRKNRIRLHGIRLWNTRAGNFLAFATNDKARFLCFEFSVDLCKTVSRLS